MEGSPSDGILEYNLHHTRNEFLESDHPTRMIVCITFDPFLI